MKRRSEGFTLIEVMIVVTIITLVAVLALPSFLRARKRSQAARFLNDLRTLSGIFESYHSENNNWPADRGRAVVPPEIVPYLGHFQFSVATPIGGNWDWNKGRYSVTAAISVDAPGFTKAEMTEMIDARIDDGDITKGAFIQSATTVYTSVLEK